MSSLCSADLPAQILPPNIHSLDPNRPRINSYSPSCGLDFAVVLAIPGERPFLGPACCW